MLAKHGISLSKEVPLGDGIRQALHFVERHYLLIVAINHVEKLSGVYGLYSVYCSGGLHREGIQQSG